MNTTLRKETEYYELVVESFLHEKETYLGDCIRLAKTSRNPPFFKIRVSPIRKHLSLFHHYDLKRMYNIMFDK
jgi:hypothetical protein